MNPLPGNPHHREANSGECTTDAYVQAQATLALAYEQRNTTLAILISANIGGSHVARQVAEVQNRLGFSAAEL